MKRVTVVVFGGRTEEKILVKELDDMLLVTTPEEFEAAQLQDRPPVTVGFRREYLVE